MKLIMKSILILTSLVLSVAHTWGQAISVPTFGPIVSNPSSIDYTQGQTFGQGNSWKVTGSGSSIDVIGGLWQSPDGLQNIDMDGYTVGQITTTITLPTAGNVTLDFWLSGNCQGAPEIKTLGIALGISQQQVVTYDIAGNTVTDMNWTPVSLLFPNQSAGQESLTFTSLDGPLGAFGHSFGPAVGTVTAFENVPEPSTLGLIGMGVAGLAWRRRRIQ